MTIVKACNKRILLSQDCLFTPNIQKRSFCLKGKHVWKLPGLSTPDIAVRCQHSGSWRESFKAKFRG